MSNQTTTAVLTLLCLAMPVALDAQAIGEPGTAQSPLPGSLSRVETIEPVSSSAELNVDDIIVRPFDGLPPGVGTPVPEPETFLLVGAGVLSVVALRRRRKR